jgi:hypothetical protein
MQGQDVQDRQELKLVSQLFTAHSGQLLRARTIQALAYLKPTNEVMKVWHTTKKIAT